MELGKGVISMKHVLVAGVVTLALAGVAAVGMTKYRGVQAQQVDGQKTYVYGAKFVCGKQQPTIPNVAEDEPLVRPANYSTIVNIHNPHLDRALLLKKVALAEEEPKQGSPTNKKEFVLGPDSTTEASCHEIRSILNISPHGRPFISGFFVIESPVPLDVVGVYTASAPPFASSGSGISEDVEIIEPHVIP